MKKFNLILPAIFSLAAVLFTACDKEENDNNDVAPEFTIELVHRAGIQQFQLDSTYTTITGDVFTPTLFKYFVSNVSLIRTDNSEYVLPPHYFLVNHEVPGSMILKLTGLKSGSYKAIKFLLGVDSTRNVSGAQTGALAADNGMFWDWNTGYIFFKIEGTSPEIPGPSQFFEYHIGGFQGANNSLREIAFDFNGDILNLSLNKAPEVHVVVDVLEVFIDPTAIDLATFPSSVVMQGPDANIIADNYVDMFTYDHMHDE